MRSPYRERIVEIAGRQGIDPLLVEAIVWQESAGHAEAFRFEPAYWERYCKDHPDYRDEEPRRIASSYGLMQIMYPTAREHGYTGAPEGLFDLETNLEIGCRVLRHLLDRFPDDLTQVLAAYNGGVGGVNRPGPQSYAIRVRDRYERFTAVRPRPDRAGRHA